MGPYTAPMPAQIPRDQYAVYVKDFNVFDVDENGALEEIEITAMIKHQTKNASPEQVASLAAEFDKNGDGKIDLEEYITKVVGGEWEITECANGDETKMKKLLAKIKRSDLGELKSFSAPPEGVKDACNALHILLEDKSAEWKGMTNPNPNLILSTLTLTVSRCIVLDAVVGSKGPKTSP